MTVGGNMATTTTTFTWKQIQEENESGGKKMLIFEGKVYDVAKWIDKHPGGPLLIEHMLGRDCTDQILANHSERSVRNYLPMLRVGEMVESERGNTYDRPLSMAFRQLYKKVHDKGLYICPKSYYVKLYSFIIILFISSWLVLLNSPDTFWGVTVSAVLLAACWHQSAGIMHDAGHNAISHKRLLDNSIGVFFTNCLTGVGIGWWKSSHFAHHLVTNDVQHDPHIQLLPFFAITNK